MKAIFLSLLGLLYFVIYLWYILDVEPSFSICISNRYRKVNSQLKFHMIFSITNCNLNTRKVNCVRNWCGTFITKECSQVKRETNISFVPNPIFIVCFFSISSLLWLMDYSQTFHFEKKKSTVILPFCPLWLLPFPVLAFFSLPFFFSILILYSS